MRLPNSECHAALDAIGVNGPDREVLLSTTPLTVTTTGLSGVTEPVAASYSRASLPASEWAVASDRAIQSSQVAFPAPTQDWGVIVAYALTDGAGVPSIPFVPDEAMNITAGSTPPKVTPRISSPLNN